MTDVTKNELDTALADVNRKIEKLTESIAQINVNVSRITQQQSDSVPVSDYSGSGHFANTYSNRRSEDDTPIASELGPANPSPPSSGACSGASFDQIKERYSRHSLPPHLRVHDPAAGIRSECKPALKILSKSARYAETALKILSELCPQHIPQENPEINDLVSVLTSQINFLQSEYSGLVVRSTFDEETSRLFRSLESNSSAFSERSLSNVRVAAELAAIAGRNGQRGTQRTGRGGRGNRGHGYSNFSSRGFFNNNSFHSNNRFRGGGSNFPDRPNGESQQG